jgi:hypothetical protein
MNFGGVYYVAVESYVAQVSYSDLRIYVGVEEVVGPGKVSLYSRHQS